MALSAQSSLKTLSLCLIFSGCTPTSSAENFISGSYSMPVQSALITNAYPADASDCAAGEEYLEGTNFCIQPTEVEDTLSLNVQENGNLEFDIFTNAFNGHSCSASGIALPTPQQNRWRFEHNNDGAICKVDISIRDGAIVFEQDYDAGSDCRAYCGNRAALGASFPLSSLNK